jgi:hypothetical protein
VARLGGREDPELRHVRRADDHEARLAQAAHEVGAVVGAVAGQEPGAEVHAQVCDRDVRLDGDRHAGERPLVARLDRVGSRERPLGVDLDEGVDLLVQVLDPRQRGGDHFARGDLPTPHERGELLDRLEHEVGGAHAAAAAYANSRGGGRLGASITT